jgi:hypothetical protein
MPALFDSTDAFIKSGFLFRIVDNGGETYDRITVTTCDGDAALCSSGGVCTWTERMDIQIDADAVEAGTARDLRWIDLDPSCQRSIVASLNEGFKDWLEAAPAAASREEACEWEGIWSNIIADKNTPSAIYKAGDAFMIREYDADEDRGPFATFTEAVRYALPQDYDLSGPEYFSTVDLADETDGPADPWDRETDPPVIDENHEMARVAVRRNNADGEALAWFATGWDAIAWVALHEDEQPDEDELFVDNPTGW